MTQQAKLQNETAENVAAVPNNQHGRGMRPPAPGHGWRYAATIIAGAPARIVLDS